MILQYCFALASMLDHMKTVCIVEKHVDGCSEYQFAVNKSLEKKVKLAQAGFELGRSAWKSLNLTNRIVA